MAEWTALIALILVLGGSDDSAARADELQAETVTDATVPAGGASTPLDCETLLDSFENDLRFVTRERAIQTRGFVVSLADEGYSTLEQDVITDLAGVTETGDSGYLSSWHFLDLSSIREYAVLPGGSVGNATSQHRELVEAIEQGATLSEFEALLGSTGVDVGSTWVSVFPFRLNLAMVGVAYVRPDILRFLIERGVDPTDENFSALDGIADALHRDAFSLPEPQLSVALSDIVRQLISAGDRAHRPSTVSSIQRALTDIGEIPLRADVEKAAKKPEVIRASEALASVDAEWNARIDLGTRIESECIGKAPGIESMELRHSLAAKMRFEEALESQQQQILEQFRRQSDRLGEMLDPMREDLIGVMSSLEPLFEAKQESRWEEVVELMDATNPLVRQMASGLLSKALEEGASIDVIAALIEHNHGNLPPDAILDLVEYRTDGSVDIARRLEQHHGLDVHFVDEDGRNAFSVLIPGGPFEEFYELSSIDQSCLACANPDTLEWAYFLADREVTPKPYRWGLDPLDRLLKKMVDLTIVAPVAIGYVRLLIDKGAPVELSHLELADRLHEKSPAAHRALMECVPELSVGRRPALTLRMEAPSKRE